MDELEGKPQCFGGYACERLNHMHLGKASWGKPRRKPESGNPTFRDCRGASGDVTLVEMGTHLTTERAGMVTLHLTAARPSSIPTTSGSARGSGWNSLGLLSRMDSARGAASMMRW